MNLSRDCKLCYPNNWPVWIQCGSSEATSLGLSCSSTLATHYKCVSDGACPHTLGSCVTCFADPVDSGSPIDPQNPAVGTSTRYDCTPTPDGYSYACLVALGFLEFACYQDSCGFVYGCIMKQSTPITVA